MVEVFREVRRVLRKDGTLWLNLGSSFASGDMRSSRSRNGAPAYGSDGKELPNSNAVDRACPDCGGELQACSLNHRESSARNGRQIEPVLPAFGQTNRNKANSVCSADGMLLSDVSASTISSSTANVFDACAPSTTASVGRSEQPTFFDDARLSVDSSACMNGTARNGHPSSDRKWDKAFVCTACGYSTRMYPNFKPKDLINTPFFVAEALRADGWYLRQDIVWSKPNPMPESVTDRCTKAHEYIFLLSKSARYFYDADAIKEEAAPYRATNYEYTEPAASGGLRGAGGFKDWRPDNGRNKRSVWEVATQPFSEAHFATFPPALIEPCIKAGTSEKGCCSKCGAPWMRKLTESQGGKRSWHDHAADATHGMAQCKHGQKSWDSYEGPKTIGWSPSCRCDAAAVPCTVLDPFAGAGTTGLVADRLQRSAILIELNPSYSAMSERRIVGDAPLFVEMHHG